MSDGAVTDTFVSRHRDAEYVALRREVAQAESAWLAGADEPMRAWAKQSARWDRYQAAKRTLASRFPSGRR